METWIESLAYHLGNELGVVTGIARLFIDENWSHFANLFEQGLRPEIVAYDAAEVLR